MKILILGITGMLGHTLYIELSKKYPKKVYGTTRRKKGSIVKFFENFTENIIEGIDASNFKTMAQMIQKVKPDVIINCIGIIKQLDVSKKPIPSIQINSLLPHLLAEVCDINSVRLIHISTDCVFRGNKGKYNEEDISDANDLYGRSKYLGEVTYGNCLTIRTSIIGHELETKLSLVDWFLSQQGQVKGFTNAIFSGLPTVELIDVISSYILNNDSLVGLYHIASKPIDKYKLLQLIKKYYKKNIQIKPFDDFEIDRSLDSKKFMNLTGYCPPDWDDLINKMYMNYKKNAHESI